MSITRTSVSTQENIQKRNKRSCNCGGSCGCTGKRSEPLGNIASCVVTPENANFQTIASLTEKLQSEHVNELRKESKIRKKLLHTSRKSLKMYSNLTRKVKDDNGKTHELPVKHRIEECHYGFVPGENPTIKNRNDVSGWGHVKKCDNAFCPSCSTHVGHENRLRLARILGEHYSWGGSVVLLTLNMQHDGDHTSADNVEAHHTARRKMTQSVRWRKLCERAEILGTIWDTDVTFSPINGTHHHFHVLLLVGRSFDERDWQRDDGNPNDIWNEIAYLWNYYVDAVGRDCINDIAVDLRVGDQYIVEYLAKHGRAPKDGKRNWDITAESTLHTAKRARDGHYTILDLLILADNGDIWASQMYADYVDAMYNKPRLTLSQYALDLEEIAPELPEIEPENEDAIPPFEVTRDAFRVARNHRDKRSHWLELHEAGNLQLLAWEVAHDTVLGKFLYQASIVKQMTKDGWHVVSEVCLQGQNDFVDVTDVGYVCVKDGRVEHVVITQPIDSGLYGKILLNSKEVQNGQDSTTARTADTLESKAGIRGDSTSSTKVLTQLWLPSS